MSKALFKYYLRSAGILAAIMSLYVMITVSNNDYAYTGEWLTLFLPVWGIYALVCMNRMRTAEFYGFINALPVTHRQQWMTLWMVNAGGVTVTGTTNLLIYIVNYSSDGYKLSYFLLPVIAEIVVTICLVSLVMWLCTIRILSMGRMMLYGLIYGAVLACYKNLGRVAGFMLNYKGNNFAYIVSNKFNFYIAPLKEFRLEVSDAMNSGNTKHIPDVSDSSYAVTYVLMTLLFIVITLALIYFGTRNHDKADLSKDINDQMIYPKKTIIYIIMGLVIVPVMLVIVSTAAYCNEAQFTSSDKYDYETVVIKGANGYTRSGICYEYGGNLYNYSYFDMNFEMRYLIVFIIAVSIGTIIAVACGKIICNGIYRREDEYSDRQIKSNNKI